MYSKEQDARDQFEDMLNQEGEVLIAGIMFDRATILREMDPIAYDEEFTNFCDSMGIDLDEEDEDDGQPTEMEEWHSFDPDC
jgi:hypothetical protein